jgi:hypothetical protein
MLYLHGVCGEMEIAVKTVLPLLLLGLMASSSLANSYTYTPNPADLGDLDHHSAYTWRIDNIKSLTGGPICAASLTFNNIANWDSSPNMLFIHLFDTAKNAGVKSYFDAQGFPVPDDQIIDNFAPAMLASNPLIANGTGNTFLTNVSFTTTPTTFTYNFTAAQLLVLQQYITNGKNIAFGFDPDCHFWNTGITFTIKTGILPVPVPVPDTGSTMIFLALALLALAWTQRKAMGKIPFGRDGR